MSRHPVEIIEDHGPGQGVLMRIAAYFQRSRSYIRGGVKVIAVVGKDSDRIEEIIDELVVGDGIDERRFILTSSHPDEPLESVVCFASLLTDECARELSVISVNIF